MALASRERASPRAFWLERHNPLSDLENQYREDLKMTKARILVECGLIAPQKEGEAEGILEAVDVISSISIGPGPDLQTVREKLGKLVTDLATLNQAGLFQRFKPYFGALEGHPELAEKAGRIRGNIEQISGVQQTIQEKANDIRLQLEANAGLREETIRLIMQVKDRLPKPT